MSEEIHIPADMIDHELSEKCGGTVASIRDLLIALGASDEELRDMDERDEILKREPWRRDSLRWVPIGNRMNGMQLGFTEGSIDWSGTRFENVG